MGKKLDKKLDLILSELAKLKADVKALAKQSTAPPKSKAALAKPARKAPAKKKAAVKREPKAGSTNAPAPKRPVLVAPTGPQAATSR